jgi:hypothetical protein
MSILSLRPRVEPPVAASPAAERYRAARLRDRQLLDEVAVISRQISAERGHISAHSEAKAELFNVARLSTDLGAEFSRVSALASRAAEAERALATLEPQLTAAQVARAAVVATLVSLDIDRHAALIEQERDGYIAAFVALHERRLRLVARAQVHDELCTAVGMISRRCGWPKFDDGFDCWVPALPAFANVDVPSRDAFEISREIDAEKARVRAHLAQQGSE